MPLKSHQRADPASGLSIARIRSQTRVNFKNTEDVVFTNSFFEQIFQIDAEGAKTFQRVARGYTPDLSFYRLAMNRGSDEVGKFEILINV